MSGPIFPEDYTASLFEARVSEENKQIIKDAIPERVRQKIRSNTKPYLLMVIQDKDVDNKIDVHPINIDYKTINAFNVETLENNLIEAASALSKTSYAVSNLTHEDRVALVQNWFSLVVAGLVMEQSDYVAIASYLIKHLVPRNMVWVVAFSLERRGNLTFATNYVIPKNEV